MAGFIPDGAGGFEVSTTKIFPEVMEVPVFDDESVALIANAPILLFSLSVMMIYPFQFFPEPVSEMDFLAVESSNPYWSIGALGTLSLSVSVTSMVPAFTGVESLSVIAALGGRSTVNWIS